MKGGRGAGFLKGGGIDARPPKAYNSIKRGDNVVIAVVLMGFFQIGALLGVLFLLKRWAEAKQAEIEARMNAALRAWGEPQGEGKPSKAAEVLDAMGAVVGAAAARTIMSSLAADASHTARAANTLSDIAQGQSNPVLGLLTGGKRGKGAALARLAEIIGPMLSQNQGNHDQGTAGARSVRDRLGRG